MEAEETGALGQLIAFCLRSLQGLGDEDALERVRSRVPKAESEEGEGGPSDEVAGRAIARIVQEGKKKDRRQAMGVELSPKQIISNSYVRLSVPPEAENSGKSHGSIYGPTPLHRDP